MDEALAKAGGFGKYQWYVLVVIILSMNAPGLIAYGVAYYEFDPPYLCNYQTSLGYTQATHPFTEFGATADQDGVPCNRTVVCDS